MRCHVPERLPALAPGVFGPTIGTQPWLHPPAVATPTHRPMTEALAKILVADDEPDLRALLQRYPVSYTHLTLPTIYSV